MKSNESVISDKEFFCQSIVYISKAESKIQRQSRIAQTESRDKCEKRYQREDY